MPQRGRENAESVPVDDGGLHVSDQFLLHWVSMGASVKGLLFKKVVVQRTQPRIYKHGAMQSGL